MKERIYTLHGEATTTNVAYDDDAIYFSWEEVNVLDDLRQKAADPKKKFFQAAELSSVSKITHYPDNAHILMDYTKKGRKKSVSFSFVYMEDCDEFLESVRSVCNLNVKQENADGKVDIAKEVMGIIGIVLFFTIMLIFFHPGSSTRPTRQLTKLIHDLILHLGYPGTIGVAIVLILMPLWKIWKKLKNRPAIVEYTR